MKKGKKAALIISCVILGLILILYILFPAVMGIVASTRGGGGDETPPDGFTDITLTASDGITLSAWYAPPVNGICILLLHGSHCSRADVRGYAQMLKSHGYGVLAPDLRGHGKSGGGGNAFGWECGLDVEAAISYLNTQEDVKSIGALGLSLGGEILLRTCSSNPLIKAIVADGATHSTLADYLGLPANQSLWRSWSTRVMYFFTGVFTGQKPPEITILDSIKNAGETRFLLIAAEKKPEEKEYDTMYADAAEGRAELWNVPACGHTEAFSLYPEEYEKRVTEFFDASLNG